MGVGAGCREGREPAGALDVCQRSDGGIPKPGLLIRWDTTRTLHATSPPGDKEDAPLVAVQKVSQECREVADADNLKFPL